MRCDWCAKTYNNHEARFVVVTGRIDTMETEVSFICMIHADKLCAERGHVVSRNIAGIRIDEFELQQINRTAEKYYNARESLIGRGSRGSHPLGGTGNISVPRTQPYNGSVRRAGGFYWDQGEVRFHIPVY